MPSLKSLVSVVAVALFVVLGVAPSAAADVAAGLSSSTVSGTPSAAGGLSPVAGARLPLPSPAPPPARPEDALPDGGAPGWLWTVVVLLAGAGGSVAVLLWRGSRPPENSQPVLENTAELVAVGRRQALAPRRDAGEVR